MVLAAPAQRAGESERAVAMYVRAAAQWLERYALKGVGIRIERGIHAGAHDEALA